MRISDQDYFRSCIAKERHLAQLLGHRQIEECYESVGTLWDGARKLPAWTRDWAACGPLLARYGLSIVFVTPEGRTSRIRSRSARPGCALPIIPTATGR